MGRSQALVARLSPQLRAEAVEELQGDWLAKVAFLRFPFGQLHVGVAQAMSPESAGQPRGRPHRSW